MKRFFIGALLLLLFIPTQKTNAQVLSESAKRKVTVGIDLFSDFWTGVPSTVNARVLNQATNVFLTYNIAVGKSKYTTFGIGLGVGSHNLNLKDGKISDIKASDIQLVPADTSLIKRDKISLSYLELPLELKFRGKKGFKFSIGLKIGYLIGNKEKYMGALTAGGPQYDIKSKGISQLNTFNYSPIIRIGYKSFNLFASYQLVSMFKTGHGPELHPISVGITLTPF